MSIKRIIAGILLVTMVVMQTACGLTINPKDFKDAPAAASPEVQAIMGACYAYLEKKETAKFEAFGKMKDGAWASAFSDMKELAITMHLGRAQKVCENPTNIYDYAIQHDKGLFDALNNAMGHLTDLGKTGVMAWLGSRVVKGFQSLAANSGTHNNFQVTGDGNKVGSATTDTKTNTMIDSRVDGEGHTVGVNPAGTTGPNQQQTTTTTEQNGVIPEGYTPAGPPAAEEEVHPEGSVPAPESLPSIGR